MQIKCKRFIDFVTGEELNLNLEWLTKNKTYLVFAIFFDSRKGFKAMIQADHDFRPCLVYLTGFEIIDQEIPKTWITKINEKDNITTIQMFPKNWDYDTFFEDLSEDEPRAVELFKQEAKIIAGLD